MVTEVARSFVEQFFKENQFASLADLVVQFPDPQATVQDVLDSAKEFVLCGDVVVPCFKFSDGSLFYGFISYNRWKDSYFGTENARSEFEQLLRVSFSLCGEKGTTFLGYWNGDVLLN